LHKMMTGELTIRQQRFLELYLGAEPGLSGNSTKSYMAAYGCSEKCAGASGPRLLANVRIKEAIAKYQERLQEKIDVTAETVLRDAIRLRDIGFGDIPGTYERMVKEPKTGEQIKVIVQLRQFNPQAVGKAIELMGRNRIVQAFQDSVKINYTHRLEELLNARTKKVEAAAKARRLRLVKDDP
jgi:phage terminase small subunit